MAKTEEKLQGTGEVYSFTGSLLEACSCNVLCPCWIGEDPDLGDCRTFLSFHIDSGRIKGMDVSDLSVVIVAYVPGNILAGNWDAVVLIDERATPEQREALLAAFGGQLGGPIADWAQLIGTVKGVEYVPIAHEVKAGVGSLVIGGVLESEMEPFRGADGTVTTLAALIGGIVLWQSKRDPCREWNEAVERRIEDPFDLFSLGGASPLPPTSEHQIRKQAIREATAAGEVTVAGTTYRRPAGCVTSPAPSLAS